MLTFANVFLLVLAGASTLLGTAALARKRAVARDKDAVHRADRNA